MVFWGDQPSELRGHPAVRYLAPIRNYDRFFSRFARSGFDVGLAPLLDDVFHRSKTDVKFREYAACGIAGVYSRVGAYVESAEEEVTGLLVSESPGEWFAAISRLIEDVDLR
jgi:glycosyltransferase involved in cell wall biosynthesis